VRAEHKDRPEVVREIDHLVLFPDEARARQAATAFAKLGYRVDPVRKRKERGGTQAWAVEFHRDDRLDGNRPHEITGEILDIIVPLGGDYDGWGAVIER
jgi:regulator of RNase E activity RraB